MKKRGVTIETTKKTREIEIKDHRAGDTSIKYGEDTCEENCEHRILIQPHSEDEGS